MAEEGIAQSYAEALYELAEAEGIVDRIGRDLALVRELWEEVSELGPFLSHPGIPITEKEDFLARALSGRVHAYTMNALRLMLRRGRAVLFPNMCRAFLKAAEERGRLFHVTVRTAQVLSDGTKEAMRSRLEKALGRPVVLEVKLAPELIAGAEVEVTGHRLDASLSRRLERLAQSLKG